MLTIRREQTEPLEAMVRSSSERAMARHLAEFAPEIADRLGAPGMLSIVREGLKRAWRHGFTNYGPVRFYLELMLVHGWFFDEDPQLPWASATLDAASLDDQMAKAERLFERMTDHREEVYGAGNTYLLEALEKLRNFGFEAFFVASDTFEASVENALKQIYPQKCAYVGGERLSDLIQNAVAAAGRLSLSSRTGVVALSELMIFFGARVVEDPLYSWVGELLRSDETGDAKALTNQLYAETKKFIERVAEYWRPEDALWPSSPVAGDAAWVPFGISERKPPSLVITTEAVVTVPGNRWRKAIGVGEEVILNVTPGSAQWSLSGGGRLSATHGRSVAYTAGDQAGDVTITATGCGAETSITLTVVAPAGLLIERAAGGESERPLGPREAGFLCRLYLQPADVSFHNVEVREQGVAAVATGAYTPWNGLARQPGSSFLTVGDAIEGKGTPVNCTDDVRAGDPGGRPPFEKGALVFEVPWEYRVGAGSPTVFATVEQRQVIDRNGRVEISKGEVAESHG